MRTREQMIAGKGLAPCLGAPTDARRPEMDPLYEPLPRMPAWLHWCAWIGAALASAALCAVIVALIVLCAAIAWGKPPPGTPAHPEWHGWFEAQHSVKGDWCCDVSDGHVLSDDDWRQADDQHYQVRIDGAWIDVPDSALRDPKGGPNPTGHAIVWFTKWDGRIHIYCFAPGWQS